MEKNTFAKKKKFGPFILQLFPFAILNAVLDWIIGLIYGYLLKNNFKSFYPCITLYLIEMHFNVFANRADTDQAALVRAA